MTLCICVPLPLCTQVDALTKDARTQEAELKVKQADADAAMEVGADLSTCPPYLIARPY
jgi:hypothetical protein